MGREGRDRPALREGRQERRVPPRRQADPRPQLRRLPHAEGGRSRPGNLVLDDDKTVQRRPTSRTTCPAPTTAWRWTRRPKFGHKPVIDGCVAAARTPRATSACSSRGAACWSGRSSAERLDGWTNDDFPTETDARRPDDAAAARASRSRTRRRTATAPTSTSPAASCRRRRRSKAAARCKPLTDEDRRTLVRWIDLGCPIDLDYDPKNPRATGLRLDARRPAADADADATRGRRERAAVAHPGRDARLRHRAGRGQLRGRRRLRDRRRRGRREPGGEVQADARQPAGNCGWRSRSPSCRRAS